jgi:Protein of unknown function (DUF4236)
MNWRFQKRIKLVPGVRLNLSKGGVSARVGIRGAGVTWGKSGITASGGLPGTGFSVSHKLAQPSGSSQFFAAPTPTQGRTGYWLWILLLVAVGAVSWIISH